MNFKVENDCIKFKFQKQELTEDIKSVFSVTEADIQYNQGIAKVQHEKIANLNIHEIKKLGMPLAYPYRLAIKTKGKPTTPAFFVETEFIGPQSRRFYQKRRTGVILNLDGRDFTLTNPHFTFLERLSKLSPDIKNPGERLSLWSKVIKSAPKEVVLDNKELLDFQFVKADHFCLDQKKLSEHEFQIVPELIYKEKNNGDMEPSFQLPKGISLDFKEEFLKINTVGPYYKVGNYYIQLSSPLRECLKIMKKINQESLEKRRAFYLNPMERIKKEIPEDLSEDLLEDIFFETDHFKSDRISHLGKWIPKIGIYIDPNNKNPWFPKDDIALKIDNNLFHFSPDDLDTVIKKLERKQKTGDKILIYKNQIIPVNDKTISEIRSVKNNIVQEFKSISHGFNRQKKDISLSKLVAIIKDNIDTKIYEPTIKKRFDLMKGVPSDLKDKFVDYPHQKQGLLWLQENFIRGVPGALLADDMGIGKTFQALAFLYWYKKNIKNKKPILIVAPTGLLKNWQDEHNIHLLEYGGLGRKYKAYGEFFRKDRKNSVLSVIEEMKKSDWVLTTYESVRDHHKDFFIKISWGVIVFDEIQKVKNPNSLITDAGKALESDFSIGLTGTPVENSFIDLWCISDCLYPKILGILKDFHKRYIKKGASGREIQDRLSQKRPPFILRRMKKDILNNLPEKKIIPKEVMMTKEQEDIYSEVIRKTKHKEYLNSLQALSFLKRFSIYTQDCFEGSEEQFIQSSAKLKFLFNTLESIKSKNEKVLISIEKRNLQKKIKGICSAKWDLTIDIINGDMSGENRKKTVDKFNDSKGFNIMIISPRAGGVGLNIVSANHIVHLERWWNPAVEDQCTDRIFRIGQNKTVFIYYPLAVHSEYKKESFDIVLNDLLKKKRKMREDTLIVSEPDEYEKNELYRKVTAGEEVYSNNEESFYEKPEWKALRNKIRKTYPPICMRCRNKNNLEVDHVKPRALYPELELDFNNLQILCRGCNLLKGVKDSSEWDFRNNEDN